MKYQIYHQTEFYYASIVTFSHNIARLKPQSDCRQKLIEHNLVIEPNAYESSEFVDFFGNYNVYMLIREAHSKLSVTAHSSVEIDIAKIKEKTSELAQYKISFKDAKDRLKSFNKDDIYAKQFLFESESIKFASNDIREYVLRSFNDKRDLFESISDFMSRIFSDFKFVSGFSDVTTPIEEIFRTKQGVCQDFAQFAISALRTIGLPAKYVSGYILTTPPEGGKKLFGADASHAWFSVYIPGFGWADFDPTNNKLPNEEYIILGSGRDYVDIAPLKGVVQSSGTSNLVVKVNVQQEQQQGQK